MYLINQLVANSFVFLCFLSISSSKSSSVYSSKSGWPLLPGKSSVRWLNRPLLPLKSFTNKNQNELSKFAELLPEYSSGVQTRVLRKTLHKSRGEDPYGGESERFQNELDEFRERYDDDEHDYKHHTKIDHHEAKEISFVYPILLSLLILGALFIPFISLFFFLAVSAMNCNGIGSGFSQVTPVFGRRRRRRSVEGFASFGIGGTKRSGYLKQNASSLSLSSRDTKSTLDLVPITRRLPTLVLFDALQDAAGEEGQESGGGIELDDYEFWRKQLARNTVKLRNALLKFGAWMKEPEFWD